MPRFRYVAKAPSGAPTVPFADAAEAWFWFMRCQQIRREGARFDGGGETTRPCDPDDIYRAVSALARAGRIGRAHLKTLVAFGLRESPPDPRSPEERRSVRLWDESLGHLATVLRQKAIVA